ncbi:MAG: hypothetical protein ACFE0S_13540 [Rhodospirillales bacterium]
MSIRKITTACAVAMLFGVGAVPTFAHDRPGIEVEKLTERLANEKTESSTQPLQSDAPEMG